MVLHPEERKQIENEMLFRRTNEKVGTDLDALDALHVADGNPHLVRNEDLLLDFKCECSDENCHSRIAMKLSDYKRYHTDRSSFIVITGHEVNPIEKVITAGDAFNVVRKNNVTPEPVFGAEFNDTHIDNSSS